MNSMIRGAVVGLAVMLGAQAAHAQGLSFGLGGGIVVPTGSLSDGTGTGWSGTAQLRVKPPVSPLRPYLLAGPGLYSGKTTIDGLGSSESQTKLGLNAGAGFDFGMGKAQLFAEARFHAILKGTVDVTSGDEKTAYMIPLTVGLRF